MESVGAGDGAANVPEQNIDVTNGENALIIKMMIMAICKSIFYLLPAK